MFNVRASFWTVDGVVDELAAQRVSMISVGHELDQPSVVFGEGQVLICRKDWSLSRTVILACVCHLPRGIDLSMVLYKFGNIATWSDSWKSHPSRDIVVSTSLGANVVVGGQDAAPHCCLLSRNPCNTGRGIHVHRCVSD